MVQSAIDSDFPSPTDHDLSGIGYVNYCRKMIKVINEQLTEGVPVMCWMELTPFDQKLAGYGMKKGIPMKSTFKPLEKDVDDAVHGNDKVEVKCGTCEKSLGEHLPTSCVASQATFCSKACADTMADSINSKNGFKKVDGNYINL